MVDFSSNVLGQGEGLITTFDTARVLQIISKSKQLQSLQINIIIL